jgi:hypothetical protein
MSEEVLLGMLSVLGGVLAIGLELLRRQNKAQHAKGYTLLESIDKRTQSIDEKTDRHGEWIAAHDAKHAERDRMEGTTDGPVQHLRRPARR